MYPDLSYILHALIGTQPDNPTSIVKTFGLLLVTAILASAYVLYLELKRKEEEGLLQTIPTEVTVGKPASVWEILYNGVVGFVILSKAVYVFSNFAAFQADAASVILSTKGNLLAGIIGGLIGAGLVYWEKKQKALPKPVTKTVHLHPYERIGDITVVAAISGVIGAKLFAVIEDIDQLIADPIGTLLSGSGMAIYGGLIGGFLVTYFYIKRMGIKPIHVLDAVAPALIMGSLVGRFGCHFAGDGCWGIPNTDPTPSWWIFPDWLWSYDYPNNVVNEGPRMEGCEWLYCSRLTEGVYPTSLYEIGMFAVIFAILWFLRKRIKAAGVLFFIYLIFNGIERFIIEIIRVNDRYDFLGMQLSQAQIIAIFLVLIGIIGSVIFWQRGKRDGAPI